MSMQNWKNKSNDFWDTRSNSIKWKQKTSFWYKELKKWSCRHCSMSYPSVSGSGGNSKRSGCHDDEGVLLLVATPRTALRACCWSRLLTIFLVAFSDELSASSLRWRRRLYNIRCRHYCCIKTTQMTSFWFSLDPRVNNKSNHLQL